MKNTILALTLILSACAHTEKIGVYSQDLAVGEKLKAKSGADRVSTENCNRMVTIIPISFPKSPEQTMKDVLAKNPGANSLVDMTVTSSWLYTFFYNYFCVKIEGTPATL